MADLKTIDNLEGSLSLSHVQEIRRQVIEVEGSLQDYQDALTKELKLSNYAIALHKAKSRDSTSAK